MNRTKIENVLMDMGVPTGIKGFTFITDAVEYIDEYGEDIYVTKELYPDIAKKRSTTPSRVERAIGYAFQTARSGKGNFDMVEKYIGFVYSANYSSLVMLHKKIKQECEPKNVVCEKKEKFTEQNATITASEIREIFRQELRLALNELRGIET